MEKSEQIINLSKALLQFHKEIGKIAKTSTNPFFKTKYADLPSILSAINEPLSNSGLIIVSIPDADGLTTLLIHSESGEYISATAIMKPVKNDPQAIGSAITYQRRYSIGSILNLNIDEDDDGNKATHQKTEYNYAKALPVLTPKLMDKLKEQPQKDETPIKKAIVTKQMEQMKERIKKGEKGIVLKAEQTFNLTTEQRNELVELYKIQNNE
jgi:hypothetical protein